MKALTVQQPYATLIMEGVKRFETRSWRPPTARTGGPILVDFAVHAGARFDKNTPPEIAHIVSWRSYPLGVVLGIAHLVWVYPAEVIRDRERGNVDELNMGDFSDGRFAWELEVVEVFAKPIPAKGKQGLWEWERP